MRKNTLREISKFAAGLVLGDFIFGLWLYLSGHTPITILGITYTAQIIMAWMVFDVLLFVFLFHYGWRMPERARTDSERSFHLAIGVLFTIVALLHFARIIFGINLVLGSWEVPYWLNGLGSVVTAFFAYISFSLFKKEGTA